MFGVILGKIYASGLQGGAARAAAGLGEVVGEAEHRVPGGPLLLTARYTREMLRGKGAGVRTRSPKSWAPYVTNRTAPVQPQPEGRMRIT